MRWDANLLNLGPPGPCQGGQRQPKAKTVGSAVQRRPDLHTRRCTNMQDHTTNPVVRKTLCNLLIRSLNLVGGKVFQADDRRARDRGWQTNSRHGGLSRTYRDLRFDYLIPCPTCNGRGRDLGRLTCPACGGAGRIVMNPTEVPEPEQGQS